MIARLLYMELHGRLGRLEKMVLRARIWGYRFYEMPEVLGLEYSQVLNAAARIRRKTRDAWDGHRPEEPRPVGAPETVQGRFF